MREVVLVRHGETAGQSAIRLYGKTDIALSELGRRQMARVAHALQGETFQTVIVSPLRRSSDSAAIILDGRGPSPVVVEAFSEIDFGRWEGWTFEEAAERDPENHAEWSRGEPGFRFPGGESRAGFHRRVADAASREFSNRPGTTLAVLHKGVIKIVLATLLSLRFEEYRALPVDLGSIHRLRKGEGGWRLVEANKISHLGTDWVADGGIPGGRPTPGRRA